MLAPGVIDFNPSMDVMVAAAAPGAVAVAAAPGAVAVAVAVAPTDAMPYPLSVNNTDPTPHSRV